MLVQAIITAIENGMSSTFSATIVPPQKGDVIIYNKKDFTVDSVKQELRTQASAPVLHITMTHKEAMACLFK